mmetsp:Transcript_76588/g.236556  ORF Transcript_76588/g.236556 Transcript_76588/m.236556 type:complete len:211 (+) Transcript_76588:273-905(+)
MADAATSLEFQPLGPAQRTVQGQDAGQQLDIHRPLGAALHLLCRLPVHTRRCLHEPRTLAHCRHECPSCRVPQHRWIAILAPTLSGKGHPLAEVRNEGLRHVLLRELRCARAQGAVPGMRRQRSMRLLLRVPLPRWSWHQVWPLAAGAAAASWPRPAAESTSARSCAHRILQGVVLGRPQVHRLVHCQKLLGTNQPVAGPSAAIAGGDRQ